jgi:hypothetical protein
MKRKIIVPKTISQHIEEELRKNPEFRKAYKEEVAKLRKRYKIAQPS